MKKYDQVSVLNIIPEKEGGGAQTVARELTSLLNKNRYPSEIRYLDEMGNEFNRLGPISLLNIHLKLFNFFKTFKWLKQEKALGKWIITISHIDRADWINAFSRNKNCLNIIYCHGSKVADINYRGVFGNLRKRMTFLAYKKADAIICVSNGLRDEIIELKLGTQEKVFSIYNWLDSKLIIAKADSDLPYKFASLKQCSRHKFTAVSRLTNQKQVGALLHAFAQAKFISRPLLIIVGDGEEYPHLVQQCIQLSLSVCGQDQSPDINLHDVIFTGFQANPLPFVNICNSFVSSSIWEGLPLNIIEAFILGKHVIANDCPHGPSELIQYANSLKVHKHSHSSQIIPLVKGNSDINAWVCALEISEQQKEPWLIDTQVFRDRFSEGRAFNELRNIFHHLLVKQCGS